LGKTKAPNGEWIYNHIETDERIYRALVGQVKQDFFRYSLQGTVLLPYLPAKLYDFPYFLQHPPLFVYLSWLLETYLFLAYPLVVVLESLITIWLTYRLGKLIYRDEKTAFGAALLLAVCPLGWFLSQKFWIDTQLVMMTTLAFLATLLAARRGTNRAFLCAGLALAAALLTKYTAIFSLPALLLIFVAEKRRMRALEAALLALPSLLLVGGWLALIYSVDGRLASEVIEWDPHKYPYMAQVLRRPWYFYFLFVLSFCPVYLFAFWKRLRQRERLEGPLALWVASFFLGFTGLGLLRYGFQARLVAPAFPALALLAASGLARIQAQRQWVPLAFGIMLLLFGAGNGLAYGTWLSTSKTDFDLNVVEVLLER
jgi:4-amino-4-deoxy-L-arabinose transferase-like glycosyltransferase